MQFLGNRFSSFITVVIICTLTFSCSDDRDDNFLYGSVIDYMESSGEHATFLSAVNLTKFREALSGPGPYTLFAPVDAAFASMDANLRNEIFNDHEGELRELVLYHILIGYAGSVQLTDGRFMETQLTGKKIKISREQSSIFVNDARIIIGDVLTENGVVHVISEVLLPSDHIGTPETIMDIIAENSDLSIFKDLLEISGLTGVVAGDGPFTVFAPTNEAFESLEEHFFDSIMNDPSGLMTDILLNHLIGGKHVLDQLSDGDQISTFYGEDIVVSVTSEGVYINQSKIIDADLEVQDGVVHVVDAVLLTEIN